MPCQLTENFIPFPDSIANLIFNGTTLDEDLYIGQEVEPTARIEYHCRDVKLFFRGIRNSTCLENGTWTLEPHNTFHNKYCIDPEVEAIREKIAHYMTMVSILVIILVSVACCVNYAFRASKRKKKVRAMALERQNKVMYGNQAYLEDSRRFYET